MKRVLACAAILSFLVFSCKSDRLDVDVSSISVPQVKILHYEKEFFAMDTSKIVATEALLHTRFGDFSDGFINHVVCGRSRDSMDCDYALRDYLTDPSYREILKECNKVTDEDYTQMENELTDAFKHFRYHFPKRDLPKGIYSDMTGFNYGILSITGYYAFGLEFYLGEDNTFYYSEFLREKWPGYRRRVSRKEYIVTNLVQSWMRNEFPYDPPKNDLINKMVYEGKILYLQKALLRDEPDSIITGYPQSKLDWAVDNEAKMWATLIEQKKVYSDNEEDLNHFTEDGAFTPGFPKDSPGKGANWLGLRIVEAYMEKFPKTTLDELMNQKDGALILNKSKYKPKF